MIGATIGNRMIAEFGRELELAREIQQQILPARPVQIAGYDLAGRCEPTGSVGGDYFDYLPMGDDRTLAVVADVSGHNLASGMLMVGARSSLKLLASTHQAPGAVFDDLLDCIFNDLSRTEQFITAVGVALGPRSDCLEIVNAGHNDTLIYRSKTGTIEHLPSTDTILGFIPHVKFRTVRTDFGPGDVAFLFTDGVTEAQNGAGEMYGESRLDRVLSEHALDSAARILDAVFESVESFIGAVEKPDDVTAVVIKREAHS
jgi:sigma-B regulation protein RsbU (phosphoserine phosphatase)